jgi:nucleotide-binding universal stress UspA family protein
MERIKKRAKLFCEKELKDDPERAHRVESIEVYEGFPAEEILSKADELNCDAIIMGTHGKGIIANTFLGSTSKRVLRRTRKPVFIISLPKGELDITFHDF